MIALALSPTATTAALACRENAMLVFDASGSMGLYREGRPKINLAREAAASVLPDVTGYRPTGLVTYSGEGGPFIPIAAFGDVPQRSKTQEAL